MQNRLTALACFLFLMYLAGASSAEIPNECVMTNATAMFCDYPFYNLTVNPEPVNYFYGSEYQEFTLTNKHTTSQTACAAYVFNEKLLERRAEIYKTKEVWIPCTGYANLSQQINGVSGFDVLDEPPPICDVGEINDWNKKYLNVSFTNGTSRLGCINSTKNLGGGSYDTYWWSEQPNANQCLQNITGYYDITSNFSYSNETGTYMEKSYNNASVYSACKYLEPSEAVSYRIQYVADQASNKWDLWVYGPTQYCYRSGSCNFANNTDPTFNSSNYTYYTEFNISNATSITILIINASQYNFTQGVQGLEFVYVNATDNELIPWYIPKNAFNGSYFRVHLNFSKWIPPDTGAGGWFAEGRKDMMVRLYFDNFTAHENSSTFYAGGIPAFSDDFNIDGLNNSKWKHLYAGSSTVVDGVYRSQNTLDGSVANHSFVAPIELCAMWGIDTTTWHMSPTIADAPSGPAGDQYEVGWGNMGDSDDWGLRGRNRTGWINNMQGRANPSTTMEWRCIVANLTNVSGITGSAYTTSINDTTDIIWDAPEVPAWATFGAIIGTQSGSTNQSIDEILVRYRPYPDPILTSWAGFILTGAEAPPPSGETITITPYLPPDNNITHTTTINYTYDVNMSDESSTRVELWLNDTLLVNDSIASNTTLTHNFITTYGHHEYYVFAYKDTNHSINDTSANWTFDVQFNITLTQDAPADNNYTMDKTLNINYSANLSALENTTVQLYFDDEPIRNDTITSNSTFSFELNTTYGNHTWYVFAYLTGTGNETFNSTSANRSLQIFFNVSANDPLDEMNISGTTVVFSYNTSNLYAINCSTVIDDEFRDNRTIPSSQLVNNISVMLSEGEHSYHISCTANDNPAYQLNTSSRTFYIFVSDFESLLNLTTFPQNVFASPQALFFDINGLLNVLYFSSNNSLEYINIRRINNSAVDQSFYELFNRTKTFFVALREINQTTLLTFATNDTAMHFLNITSTLDISTTGTSYDVASNALFDPYSYANTKHFESPAITAASFHIFWLPTTTNTTLMRKFVNNETLEEIDGTSHNRTFAWQTIANVSNLTDWLYVAPEACGATSDRLSLYKYDGTSTKLLTLDETCYSEADLAKITVYFEAYNATTTYVMIANSTNQSIIHHIQLNRTYFFTEDIDDPSHIFFINEDTFVFFNQNATDTYAHSCYFPTTPNCTAISSDDYGPTVPYQRGSMTTLKRVDEKDYVVRGAIISGSHVQLAYTQHLYDAKFITYDEVDEYRKTFTLKIYTNTTLSVLDTGIWGYVIPSSMLGIGMKRAFATGFNGTQRLYVIGLSANFSADFYSLDTTAGTYYTLQVVNQYNVPIPNAKISAYRFSNLKQAWVVIEQGITDYSGYAILFLQPANLYRVIVEADGANTITFVYTPSAITSLQIRLTQGGRAITPPSDFETVWNDTSYSLLPADTYQPDPFNITFQISSTSSTLEYYGMRIYYNTSILIYSQNITTQSSGGMLRYEANDTGRYTVQYWFKHQDHDLFWPMAHKYYLQNKTGLALARQTLIDEEPISGWGYYFIAVIFSMLVVGYVSRYSMEGAGMAGLITLWIFTMLYPDAIITCLIGGGACITPLRATFLTTISLVIAYVLNKIL